MSIFNLRVFMFFVVLSLSLFVSAQNSIDSLQRLDEVTVVAKPFQEVIPSQKLSGKQLEGLATHSVADALRYFAGVQLKDYGGVGGMKTVNVRSMGTHHLGVYYDGIQLGNAQNGVVDLGKFSLDDVEEISLYNGQKSDIFQSAKDFSSASALYIQSKRPRFRDGKNTNLTVRYKLGTIKLINPSMRVEQKLTDKISVSLSSEFVKSDGRYDFRLKRIYPNGSTAYDTTATRIDGDIEALRLESGLYGTMADGMWDAKLYFYDSNRGLPAAIVANEAWTHQGQAKFRVGKAQRLWDKNFFAQSSFRKSITDRYQLQARSKFAFDYTRYLSPDTEKLNYVDNHYYQQEAYFSLANIYSITNRWDVSLASDFQWSKLNADLKNFSYPQRYTNLVSLSSSCNWGKVKAQASLLATFVHETVKQNSKSPNKDEYTPAVFVGYKPFEKTDLNFRAFYKRIFRMPTFNDLYYTEVGNSILRPEYTNQYNLGFTYNKTYTHPIFKRFNLQVDAYYNEATDKIVAAPGRSQFRFMMMNLGKTEIRGIDLVAAFDASFEQVNINTHLSYTYQKAQDFDNPLFDWYGEQIPYVPWHSGSAILGLNYSSFRLNYSFIYVGERYDSNLNNIEENHLQPWYTHDLSLTKDVQLRNVSTSISVEANNLLDQQFEVIRNHPMPGRNFKFILSIKL